MKNLFIKKHLLVLSTCVISFLFFNSKIYSQDIDTLEWEEIRKENKKKIKEIKQILVPYKQIKEAKIQIKI